MPRKTIVLVNFMLLKLTIVSILPQLSSVHPPFILRSSFVHPSFILRIYIHKLTNDDYCSIVERKKNKYGKYETL